MIKLIPESTKITAAGTKEKIIEEFVGRVNSQTEKVSIALMHSPEGWEEPGQTPEFDEYTLVLNGMLRVSTREDVIDVYGGQAIIVEANEWVQYRSPLEEGAEYISVCIPAFSPDSVHRD
jgi:mannose-6-phosphate isomerase-like protein (cupin superfamily)